MITIEYIQNVLEKYLVHFPEESQQFDILKKQILSNEDIVSRKNFNGHVTASGLVISHNKKVLAIFHNKLQKFLQPGGHIEKEDEYLIDSAKREIMEETNLQDATVHPWCWEKGIPILIDTHVIPENKNKGEDAHFHHDCMFVFYVQDEYVLLDQNEVSDFKWVDVETVMKDDSMMAKALRKMKKLEIL